jgi:hypothetical protein
MSTEACEGEPSYRGCGYPKYVYLVSEEAIVELAG